MPDDQAGDVASAARGPSKPKSRVTCGEGPSSQISRIPIGQFNSMGSNTDLSVGVHLMTRDPEEDSFQILESALKVAGVTFEVTEWAPPRIAQIEEPGARLILIIGNPE